MRRFFFFFKKKVFYSHALHIGHNLKCYWETFTEKSVFVVVGFFVFIFQNLWPHQDDTKMHLFCFVYCSREKLNQTTGSFLPRMCGERHCVAGTGTFLTWALHGTVQKDACWRKIAFLES